MSDQPLVQVEQANSSLKAGILLQEYQDEPAQLRGEVPVDALL